MKKRALAGIRVIDLTHWVAGPYCTKLFAGHGAEVVKIERPGTGDSLRENGPFFQDREGLERSIPFLWLNTGKKGITLNLKSAQGREIFIDLIKGADLLVENFSPGVMARLGLEYETLRKDNPKLVMTSISNFGQTGGARDFKAEEIEMQALSGLMSLTGEQGKPPLVAGPAICQYSAGQHAYFASLMALFQRNGKGGEGQYIDVAIRECGMENIEIAMTGNLHNGSRGKRGVHMMVPWGTYECADGYATVIAMPYRHWPKAAELFAEPELFAKKYEKLRDRIDRREEYDTLLRPCVKRYQGKNFFQEGQRKNLAFGYVAALEEVTQNPQHQARDFFRNIDHPEVGRHMYCDAPFRMSKNAWQTSRAPLLGEDNAKIFGQLLGYSQEKLLKLQQDGVI